MGNDMPAFKFQLRDHLGKVLAQSGPYTFPAGGKSTERKSIGIYFGKIWGSKLHGKPGRIVVVPVSAPARVKSTRRNPGRSPFARIHDRRNPTGDSSVRSPTSTSTEVRSPTRTATRTEAYTDGNVTVTGGAGRGANTDVTIYSSPARGAKRQSTPSRNPAAETTHFAMVTDQNKKTIRFIGMPGKFAAASQVRMERKPGVKADVIPKSDYPRMSKAARSFGFTEV